MGTVVVLLRVAMVLILLKDDMISVWAILKQYATDEVEASEHEKNDISFEYNFL